MRRVYRYEILGTFRNLHEAREARFDLIQKVDALSIVHDKIEDVYRLVQLTYNDISDGTSKKKKN